MSTVTYYYPSNFGAAQLAAPGSGTAGTANFHGTLGQYPAGSYTVFTVDSSTPGVYNILLDYTGPGTGIPDTVYQTNYSTANLNETSDGTYDFVTSNSQIPADFSNTFSTEYVQFQPDASRTADPTVCFASGTLIRTTRGDRAVETLAVGDVVRTASGEEQAIRWIGHRTLDLRTHPRPDEARPVRIAAHAFGAGKPARDLLVSPGHSICVDLVGEILIPAGVLINGSTVTQEQVETVTYWHVELDCHAILLAENLPAESYLDMGNRGFFAEADVVDLAAGPDALVTASRTHADFCRPFHQDGPIVTAVRERLASHARALGWALDDSAFAGLHLVIDGQRVEPVVRGLVARFLVPAGADEVWLVSAASRPIDLGASCDERDLGVCLAGLAIDNGFGASHNLQLDDASLGIGMHALENGSRRWTAGRARLPAALWDGYRDGFFLRVELAGPALPRWISPLHDQPITSMLNRQGLG